MDISRRATVTSVSAATGVSGAAVYLVEWAFHLDVPPEAAPSYQAAAFRGQCSVSSEMTPRAIVAGAV